MLTIYTSYDELLRAPFGGRGVTMPHLGRKIPPKSYIWGVNRHFQAKLVKYHHLHVIETTASVRAKFCISDKHQKYFSWVTQTCT